MDTKTDVRYAKFSSLLLFFSFFLHSIFMKLLSTMNNLQSKRSVSNELLLSSFFFTAHNTVQRAREQTLVFLHLFFCSIALMYEIYQKFSTSTFFGPPHIHRHQMFESYEVPIVNFICCYIFFRVILTLLFFLNSLPFELRVN